ncbi:hypothetical protein SAMN02910400_00126 [Lachnospiraceae bacterium C10]|jgi:cell division protein YceG involved in septum cleavage|nr:hypothetical protein SAMN02910400_00126 [Lachnospiraceae bacterium C10]
MNRKAKTYPVCVKVARRRRIVLLGALSLLWLFVLLRGAAGMLSYANAPTQPSSYVQLEIASGDTLDSIVTDYCNDKLDYRSFKREVVQLNHLMDEDNIHTGSYLLIPVYE